MPRKLVVACGKHACWRFYTKSPQPITRAVVDSLVKRTGIGRQWTHGPRAGVKGRPAPGSCGRGVPQTHGSIRLQKPPPIFTHILFHPLSHAPQGDHLHGITNLSDLTLSSGAAAIEGVLRFTDNPKVGERPAKSTTQDERLRYIYQGTPAMQLSHDYCGSHP